MAAQGTAPVTPITGRGKIDGNSQIVTAIRPKARIVESLRAVGLHVELKRIGRYVVPIVTKVTP
ncbi:MAG TPA: hypothetical protein VGE08_17555 [Steroidobacter sp.]|uniref:hypothetical protein n=1 Tax=Steroidobacter sp. TaxID=1978227 RepID=UPI002EDA14A4